MKRIILGIMLALIPLSAMGQAPAGQTEKALENYTRTGKREMCIPLHQIKNTQIIDSSGILFFMTGGSVYLNEPRDCALLDPHRSIQWRTSINQLCSTDIVTVFGPGSPVPRLGSCGLGQFEILEQKH